MNEWAGGFPGALVSAARSLDDEDARQGEAFRLQPALALHLRGRADRLGAMSCNPAIGGLGNQIDQMLYGFGNGYWQSEWSGIQNDLGIVANTYGINNRNGRNNRGNRNYPNSYPNSRNNRGNLPSWWPF